jgi:hypothetical protein
MSTAIIYVVFNLFVVRASEFPVLFCTRIAREVAVQQSLKRLRGGYDQPIREKISSEDETSTSSMVEIEWKGVPKVPGFEDAPPHASEHDWDPQYYIEHGIDITGGFFDPIPGGESWNWTERLDGIEDLSNFSYTREMNKLRRKIIREDLKNIPEKEKSDLVVSSDVRFTPRPKNYVKLPAKELNLEDWANMTDREIEARITTSIEQFQTGEPSVLFDADFVYGIDRNRTENENSLDNDARLRLMFSVLGIERYYLAIRAMQEENKERLRPLDRSLMTAAQDGDAQQVGFWLRRGADKDVRDCFGLRHTPLQSAALLGHLAVVRALLDHGADPLAREPAHGRTALHIAAARGNTEVVRMLVERGAPVEAESFRGRTPLHDAAATGLSPARRARRSATHPRPSSARCTLKRALRPPPAASPSPRRRHRVVTLSRFPRPQRRRPPAPAGTGRRSAAGPECRPPWRE